MHIILTGATGLVGSIALERMISDESIDKVTILSRKPVPQADGHAKITVIIHEDLAVYDEKTLAQLKGANGCIWAVGPPAMSVTKEEYEYAHIDLPVIAGKVYATLNDQFNFVYISHDGCHDARSVWILDVKARAEEKLFCLHHDVSKRLEIKGNVKIEAEALPSFNFYSIRPAFIDYGNHDEIKRWIKPLTMVKKLSNYVLLPLYRMFGMSFVIGTSQELGQASVGLATGDGKDLDITGASPEGRCLGVVGMRNWCKAANADEEK